MAEILVEKKTLKGVVAVKNGWIYFRRLNGKKLYQVLEISRKGGLLKIRFARYGWVEVSSYFRPLNEAVDGLFARAKDLQAAA